MKLKNISNIVKEIINNASKQQEIEENLKAILMSNIPEEIKIQAREEAISTPFSYYDILARLVLESIK